MVKQKLTSKEQELVEQQLRQFLKPKTLPDIIRKSILNNKWIPEKYQVYVPKGDMDDKEHFIVAEDALKALESGNMTDMDKYAIERILAVPKIANRIDYEFRGLVTKVKNSLVEGMEDEPEEKVRLHQKTEEFDIFGSSKKPMKGFDAKPIVNVGKDSKFGELEEKEEKNDNTDKESHTGNITVRRRDDTDSERDSEKGSQIKERKGIDFREEEDY